jgi:hypothetical protein
MKKTFLTVALIAATMGTNAQVGINTETPKASLDVMAFSTDATSAEGIIAPRLTLAQLKGKDAQYTSTQKGAFVYVTDVTGGTTTKTVNVIAEGYYYFDGIVWRGFTGIGVTPVALTADNGLTETSNNVQLGGALTKNTTISGTNKLTFSAPLQYNAAGTNPADGFVLTSDINGNATWKQIITPVVFGSFESAAGVDIYYVSTFSNNYLTGNNFNQTGAYIDIPAGMWRVDIGLYMQCEAPVTIADHTSIWVRSTLADNNTSHNMSADIGLLSGSSYRLVSGLLYEKPAAGAMMNGSIIVRNTTGSIKRYYLVVGCANVRYDAAANGGVNGSTVKAITALGASVWSENTLTAMPVALP